VTNLKKLVDAFQESFATLIKQHAQARPVEEPPRDVIDVYADEIQKCADPKS